MTIDQVTALIYKTLSVPNHFCCKVTYFLQNSSLCLANHLSFSTNRQILRQLTLSVCLELLREWRAGYRSCSAPSFALVDSSIWQATTSNTGCHPATSLFGWPFSTSGMEKFSISMLLQAAGSAPKVDDVSWNLNILNDHFLGHQAWRRYQIRRRREIW